MTERTGEHPNTERANTRTGEHPLASFASWVVLFASFGLSAATWIALADLAGFHRSAPLPFTGVRAQLTWLMPIAVDGYVVVALVLWMSPVPAKVAAFAKKNTYAAALVGVIAQSAFHCASVASATNSTWRAVMAAVVGAIPPAGAALSVHMRALIRRESGREQARTSEPVAEVVAPALTVRRVVVPSGLVLEGQNTQPIAVANGHPIAGQNGAPNEQANTRTATEPEQEPNVTPNTPNTVEANAQPNTEQAPERPNGEQTNTGAANVRDITTARRVPNGKPNGDTAKNLAAIKRRYRDWRTNMPSVRQCADVIGVATSTGKAYRDRLIAELAAEQESADDGDKERVS